MEHYRAAKPGFTSEKSEKDIKQVMSMLESHLSTVIPQRR